jgi:hypothetical protein
MPFNDPKVVAEYFRNREARKLAFFAKSPEDKDRFKAVAKADNLDLVSWFEHFLLPTAMKLLEKKELEHGLARPAKKR